MPGDEWFWRRAVVCASAVVYWAGVFIHGRRIRKRIGRSPNLTPRSGRERLLWTGWIIVVAGWIVQPLVAGPRAWTGIRVHPACLHPAGWFAGLALVAAGYAATLWCYRTMGNAWRIGIDPQEKNRLVTEGPYRFLRHPIYAFQIVMLAGALLLVPTPASVAILALHLACVLAKARDEELYLLGVHGDAYRQYLARTRRLLPSFR